MIKTKIKTKKEYTNKKLDMFIINTFKNIFKKYKEIENIRFLLKFSEDDSNVKGGECIVDGDNIIINGRSCDSYYDEQTQIIYLNICSVIRFIENLDLGKKLDTVKCNLKKAKDEIKKIQIKKNNIISLWEGKNSPWSNAIIEIESGINEKFTVPFSIISNNEWVTITIQRDGRIKYVRNEN